MKQSIINLIRSRLKQTKTSDYALSEAFSATDFADFGSNDAITQALSRLTRCGYIRRICKGLYDIPRNSSFSGNTLPPSLEAVAQAIARRTGSTVAFSGAHAANRLGLSEQVPAQSIYLTSGRTRTLSVGNRKLTLRRTKPSKLNFSDVTSEVVSALRYLGRANSKSETITALLSRRLSPTDKRNLLEDISGIPLWMRPIVLTIANPAPQYATIP